MGWGRERSGISALDYLFPALNVYVCVYVYTRMRTYVYAHVCMHVYTRVHMCMHARVWWRWHVSANPGQ